MREKILGLLQENGDLPPLPDIIFNLERHVNDPDSDIESIAELVETEPVLAGKLVKLANSVFFGGGREKVKNVPAVVLRLGLKALLDLAYTLALPQMFDKLRGFDQIRFWKHSMAVGFLSQSFAKHLELKREAKNDIYMAGLLHDIGILIYFYLIPEEFKEKGKELKESESRSESLEIEKLGIAHSELGAEFLRHHWPVSENVISAARTHHKQVFSEYPLEDVPSIVNTANMLVNFHGMDHEYSAAPSLPSDEELQNCLKMSTEELESLIEKTREGVGKAEKLLKS